MPDRATLYADVRYPTKAAFDKLVTTLNERSVSRRVTKAGISIDVIPVTGGDTDAGYAMTSGKPIIEALGLPGFGFHANVGEWVLIDAIPRRLYLSAQMIMVIAQGK